MARREPSDPELDELLERLPPPTSSKMRRRPADKMLRRPSDKANANEKGT